MSIEITEDFVNKVLQKENGIYKSYRSRWHKENANLLAVIFEEDTVLADIREDDNPEVKINKVIQKIKELKSPSLWLLDMSEWCRDKEIIKKFDLYIKKDSLKINEFKFLKDEINYVADKLYFEFANKKDENAVHIIDALTEIKKNIFENKEFFNKVDRVEGLWEDREYHEIIKSKLKIISQEIIHPIYYDVNINHYWNNEDWYFPRFMVIDKRDFKRIADKNYKFIKSYFETDVNTSEYFTSEELKEYNLLGINLRDYMIYENYYNYENFKNEVFRLSRGFDGFVLSILLKYSPASKISYKEFDTDEKDEEKEELENNNNFILIDRQKYAGISELLFPKDNFPQIRKWDAYIERDDINILNLILIEDIEAPELEGIKDEEEIIKIYLEKIKTRKDFFIPLQYLDRWTVSEELVKKIPIYVKNNVQQIQAHHLYLERAEKEEKDAVHIIDKLKEAKDYYINKKEIEDLALAEGYYNDLEYREKFIEILEELGTKIKHTVYSYNIRWDEKDSFFIHNKDIKRMCAFKKFGFIKELFDDIDDYDIFMMENVYLNIASYKSYEKKWKFNEQDFEADEEIVKILIENRKGELKK